jgi:hypothetical protein
MLKLGYKLMSEEHVARVDDRRHETTFLHKCCHKTLAFRALNSDMW